MGNPSALSTPNRDLAKRREVIVRIDDNTIAILKYLRDGRKSFKEIASDLSLSENTVRSRVRKLREEGILDISGLVDPEAIPGHTAVIIGVKLRTMELVRLGKELSELRGVVSVGVVTGRYDLILTVLFSDEFGLLEFFTEEMASHSEDVQYTETFVVYKGYNLRVPYIL